MTMNKKRYFLTFSILAIIVWSSSWWLYQIFMYVVHAPGYSQYKLMQFFKTYLIWSVLGYIIFQTILLKKKNLSYPLIAGKILLTIVGLYFLYRFSFRLQISQPQQLDIVFFFGLALLSGFISNWFDFKVSFGILLLAWFFIIFINEIGVQRFLLSNIRSGTIMDVCNNIIGATIGLLLSMKWFWRK